jgi:23S rRNA pseudouridine955/2504/2580 synthase
MPKPTLIEVTPAEDGQKLLTFLERRLPGVPYAALMRVIRTGQVRVDGGRKKPFFRLAAGSLVRVPPLEPGEAPAPRAHPAGLAIVHRDRDILVVAKPAGLCVQGGTGQTDSVDHRLRALFAGEPFVPALAHRLDRDTSGLLLVGRTHAGVRRLAGLFKSGGIGKTYLCWVRGVWPHERPVRIKDYLEKGGEAGDPERVRVRRRGQGGRLALAEVLRLLVRGQVSLLAVKLLTGRTHQIRVQLASRGHPLVGDAKYGGPAERKAKVSLRLHAFRLALPERAFVLAPDWEGEWAAPVEALARAEAF